MTARSIVAIASFAALGLTGCAQTGEIDASGGITAVRGVCPSVAVPAATGDITLFNPANRTTADAIDVTAVLTNVRSTCNDGVDPIATSITFDVLATRTRTDGPRDVQLPVFTVVAQGGSAVIAKRVQTVTVRFAAGQARASVAGTSASFVDRAAATLPAEVRDQITRKRKAGEQDAALDPLADPTVRSAVARATFETLVGFQLTEAQLKYNATR
ncbi:hypothetical protein [Sphingomonas sp. RS2018]